MRNALFDRVRGNVEPDRQIERRMMSLQNTVERFGLRDRARETGQNKTLRPVDSDPIFDQLDDNFIRDKLAVLGLFRSLDPKQRSQFYFPAQNRAGRGHRNPKVTGDHFGLSSFSGTGRAEEHESFSFHLAPVEENGHAADDDDGDADVEPHQRRAPRRVAARIARAIEASAADAP